MMAWAGMGLFTSSELLKLFESEDLKPTPITGVAVSQWAVTMGHCDTSGEGQGTGDEGLGLFLNKARQSQH